MKTISLCCLLLVLSLTGGCSECSEEEFFFEGDFLKTGISYTGMVQEVYDGQGDGYYQALVLIDNPRPDVTGAKVLAIFFPVDVSVPEIGELVTVMKRQESGDKRARVYLVRRSKGPKPSRL